MTPKFLFDENLSFRIARALNALSRREVLSVVDHSRLGRGSDDVEDIIQVCSEEGWDLVLNDWEIRKKPHEKEALLEGRIGVFFVFLGKGTAPSYWSQAKLFVDRWPLVEDYALEHSPPYAAMIHRGHRQIETL